MEHDGYTVVAGISLAESDVVRLGRLAGDHATPIFNYNGSTSYNDGRRLQWAIPDTDVALPVLRRQLQAAVGSSWPAGAKARDWVVLKSAPRCQAQHRHRDYDDAERRARVPMGAVVALQPGTKLDVWPGTHAPGVEPSGPPTSVAIPVGSALVFNGYLAHRGAAYTAANTRLHAYIDVPEVERRPDATHLC
jgi:hypothetical protein